MDPKPNRPIVVWILMFLITLFASIMSALCIWGIVEFTSVPSEEAESPLLGFLMLGVPLILSIGCFVSIAGVFRAKNWGRRLAIFCLLALLVFLFAAGFVIPEEPYSSQEEFEYVLVGFAIMMIPGVAALLLLWLSNSLRSYFVATAVDEDKTKSTEPPPPPVFES